MSDRFFLGTRKGLFRVDRIGGKWKVAEAAFLGDHVSMLLPERGKDTVLAALRHEHFGAKVHQSKDSGKSWEETAVPEYPPKPEDVDDKDMWGKPLPWKLVQIWSLERGQDGMLWCGTIPGGLFQSHDNGNSWQLVTSLWNHPNRKMWFGGGADLPGVHSICIHPKNAKQVAVGVSCGGVWMTKDGGDNWENCAHGMWAAYMPPEQKDDPNIQDPHRVVQCPSQPDYYWAQHHNGVFRSTNGGTQWSEVTDVKPSSFGFAIAVHPNDPEIAWFVPAIKDEKRLPVDGKVVVTRTRDGGKSFDVLTEGLPQEHAYDLTYRHSFDVDETGNRLVFGSTTGSVWVSENQGDTWTCLSAHLPPVYCVRFA